jgi:DNA repair protein RAD16
MAKPLRAASIVEGLQDAEQPIRTSSKIEALIQEIEFKLKDSSSEPQKFLVFSSFAHFLQLCGYFMDEAGITNEIISGKTDMKSRARIIQQFRETDSSVLLITLQVGGEGLNLQVANRVYLLDPWWNPAMEQQAYQRAHRALTAMALIRPD